MTVCLDTGVFLQIFGRRQPFYPILRALLDGGIVLAVSTAILLEYEEVTTRLSGSQRWRDLLRSSMCSRATSREYSPGRTSIPVLGSEKRRR